MIRANEFYYELCERGADFFVGVPDSLLQNFCAYLQQSDGQHVITANEGNAIAMAGGYHVATGRCGVVYMQNSGIGNAVNPLLSLADGAIYRLPMILLIGLRGEPGVADEPQHVTQGALTLPLLQTMNIPYLILEDDFAPQLSQCFSHLSKEGTPFALVVRGGTFAPHENRPAPALLGAPAPMAETETRARFPLSREEALTAIVPEISPIDFIVSTTGKTSRELFELREQRGESHSQDFLTVGSMGHTASIALGMAMGNTPQMPLDLDDADAPEQPNVYCIDGDGSFLMHMGSLAIAAQTAPEHFRYILINNGAHESVGGQPTVALAIDIPQILRGMGFSQVYTATTVAQIKAAMRAMRATPNSALMICVEQGSRPDLGRPTIPPAHNKWDMMTVFSKHNQANEDV